MMFKPGCEQSSYVPHVTDKFEGVTIEAETNLLTGQIVYVLTTDHKAVSGSAKSMQDVYAAAKVLSDA